MRYGISCIGFTLALLLLGASSASAGLLEETVSTVTSPPGLPAEPIQPPSPEVPAFPTVRVEIPAPAAAGSPSTQVSPVHSGSAAPSSPQVSIAPQDADAAGVRISTGSADLPTSAADEAAGAVAGRRTGGSSEGPNPADSRARRRSVDPAHPAPLRRWLARVWPAIALGPFRSLFAMHGPSRGSGGLLSTAVARGVHAILGVSAEGGENDAGSRRPAGSSSPLPGPGQPGGLQMSLLIALLASGAFVAVLYLALARGAGVPPRPLG